MDEDADDGTFVCDDDQQLDEEAEDPLVKHMLQCLARGAKEADNVILDDRILESIEGVELLCEFPSNDESPPSQYLEVIDLSELISGNIDRPPPGPDVKKSAIPEPVSLAMRSHWGPGVKFTFAEQPNAPHGVILKVPDIPSWKSYKERCAMKWNRRAKELVEYAAANNGSCDVPQRFPDNPALGIWVNIQRSQYYKKKKGKHSPMTDERIKSLEKIGFKWSLKTRCTWDDRYTELIEYKNKYGDFIVSRKCPDNLQLGTWVKNQRSDYWNKKKGKYSPMTDERIKSLETIGFNWRLTAWDDRYTNLIEYKNKYGDCNVPVKCPDNLQLGAWVNQQRDQYRKKKKGQDSQITDESIKSLEKIGFKWTGRGRKWEDRYAKLIEYKNKYGDCNVPQKCPDNLLLGAWVSKQRKEYRNKKKGHHSQITDDRIKSLEKIGFKWRI